MNQSPEALSNPTKAPETTSDAGLESGSEVQPQSREEKEQAEYDEAIAEAKEKASAYIERLMSMDELSPSDKIAKIDDAIKNLNARIDRNYIETKHEVAGEKEVFQRMEGVDPAYSKDKLKDILREIGRDAHIRRSVDNKQISVLEKAKAGIVVVETPVVEHVEADISESDTNPAETETPVEEKPEETPEAPKTNLTPEEVNEKIRQNKNLTEEMQHLSLRLTKIAGDVSPREPWYRPMNDFNEEYVRNLRAKLSNISEVSDRLRQIGHALEQNNPRAESNYNKLSAELDSRWRSVEATLDDALRFMTRLRTRTIDLMQDRFDNSHVVSQSGRVLRQMQEGVGNRRR